MIGRFALKIFFFLNKLTYLPNPARNRENLQKRLQRLCQGLGGPYRHEKTILPVDDHVPASGNIGCHDGTSHAHGFHERTRQALPPGGENDNIRLPDIGAHITRDAEVFENTFPFPSLDRFKRDSAPSSNACRPMAAKPLEEERWHPMCSISGLLIS